MNLSKAELLFIQSNGLAGTPPSNSNPVWNFARPSWVRGTGHATVEKDAKAAAALRRKGPRRFWMKPNTETQLIFVDDEAFRINEHGLRINGKWGHFETCIGLDNGCDLCAAGDEPYYVCFWTVIDRSEFTDKSGKQRKDEVRLFAAKQKVMVKLSRRSTKLKEAGYEGGLAGIVIDVARGDENSAGTGDDFDIVGQADESLLVDSEGKPIKAFNYEEILEPNPERRKQYAATVSGGSSLKY